MGAGKSSYGRKLAKAIGFRFIDMDSQIEELEGMKVSDIFSQRGEEWFRTKETEVLHLLGKIEEDVIIATGGGVPCFNNNMDFINSNGLSVYLKLSAEALVMQLSRSNKPLRPLLKGKTDQELLDYVKQKLSEREIFYQLSKIIVPAEKLNIETLKARLKL